MQVTPGYFENQTKQQTKRKQGILQGYKDFIGKNMKKVFEEVIKLNVFKVADADNKKEVLLKKIVKQLHSIDYELKVRSATGKTSNSSKVSVKTPDLMTLNKEIESILKNIEKKELKVVVPKPSINKVTGNVKVTNLPTLTTLDKMSQTLYQIKDAIGNLKLEVPALPKIEQQKIDIPPYPSEMSLKESRQIIKLLQDVKKGLDTLPKKIPQVDVPSTVSVDNFPPQRYPIPPNNININPLRGYVKSTAVTVTTSLTPLPGEVLSNRRSLVIYNNSSATTIFLGGSTMSASDGIPVPASTYSPAFDAGPRMIVYAMTSSGTADVRVLELSNDEVGSD